MIILFFMRTVVVNGVLTAKAYSEIIAHGLIPEKVVFDHISAVAQAQYELTETGLGIYPHDMREYGPPTDGDQRLGTVFGFLLQSHAPAATKDNRFHD
jgi:hypothetical protein